MNKYISLSEPYFFGNEIKNLKKCIDDKWISSNGNFVKQFEKKLSKFTSNNVCLTINCTSALHLSLILAGVKKEDEVIVPTLTFISPINAINYIGAKPIFMDINNYFVIDDLKVKKFLIDNTITITKNKKKFTINKKTKKIIKAMIVVNLFGNGVYLDEIFNICKKKGIKIIEDNAESLGSYYRKGKFKNKLTGTNGDISSLSFNGNKIITTGGGGAVLSKDSKIIERANYLANQAKDNKIYYIHNDIGFNYSMSNIHAAIGLAQFRHLKNIIKKKKQIYNKYRNKLKKNNTMKICETPDYINSNYWLTLLQIDFDKLNISLNEIINIFKKNRIEVRPLWHLNHLQSKFKTFEKYKIYNANKIIKRTLCLPSSFSLEDKDIIKIINILNLIQKKYAK